jgi:hypothetical protein
MAVEIRNRLAAAVGAKLPATLLFNYPTAIAISGMIYDHIIPRQNPKYCDYNDNEIRALLTSISISRLRASNLLERLLALVDKQEMQKPKSKSYIEEIEEMDNNELMKLAERMLS